MENDRLTIQEYCARMEEAYRVRQASTEAKTNEEQAFFPEVIKAERDALERSWIIVHKSCLFDRIVYHGEHASQTKCPVHKGVWSGLYLLEGGKELEAAGCTCWKHKCGCMTGWNVDEHCGCLKI